MKCPLEPQWMAIINLTPDSFSDGGQFNTVETALYQAETALKAGATWLDLGAESTRPNAKAISEAEELKRLLPILEAITHRFPEFKGISIDTQKATVAQEAIVRGATLINDVSGLRTSGDAMLEVIAPHPQVGLVLMHSVGTPETMQTLTNYEATGGVVSAVIENLNSLKHRTVSAGITPNRLWADVGIGFGKTLDQNLALLNNLPIVGEQVGLPLLLGVSRKSCLAMGQAEAVPPQHRDAAGAMVHWQVMNQPNNAVRICRVHDVGANRLAFRWAGEFKKR
ncbi:MAG: dihydropteroate synthase [Vampirovibrio sp.]|nr:dihydropteroate synthase [Vampirovibrio sp.]